MSTARRATFGALIALVALGLMAGSAIAHAELDTSDPRDGAVLETPPTTITLTFTQRLDPSKSSFRLFDPDGSTIARGEATGAREMALDGLELGAGAYLIKWTTGSAEDGEIARGQLTFTVADVPPTPNPTENDFITPEPSTEPTAEPGLVTPSLSAAATADTSPVAPTPAPSAAPPTSPAASTSDVLLPIVVGLLLVGGVGVYVLRRSRGA